MRPTPLWHEQCDAARRIRQHFGSNRALTYIVGQKLFGTVKTLEPDGSDSAEVRDFAAEVKTIFPPAELREYLNRARMRKHPGVPTDDLRYTPGEAPAFTRLKLLLL